MFKQSFIEWVIVAEVVLAHEGEVEEEVDLHAISFKKLILKILESIQRFKYSSKVFL